MPWDELLRFCVSVRDFTRRPIAGTRRQRLGVPRRRRTRPSYRQTPPALEAGFQEQARSRDGAQLGAQGLEEGSTRRSTMTVGDFLDDWVLVQKHRIRPTTWHGYEMRWSESSDISSRPSAKRCHLCRSRSSIRCFSSRCEQAGRFGSGSTPVAGDDVMHSVVSAWQLDQRGLDCRSRIERVRSLRSPSERRTFRGCGAKWPRSISTRPRWWVADMG